MTFQAYCRAQRMGAALKQLRRGASLDDIALGNGYESHSGFRDAFMRTFGRAPGNSRGLDQIVVSWMESPLGPSSWQPTRREFACFSDRQRLEMQFNALKKLFHALLFPVKTIT
jgi:AraC family transcriptional regulator of adaptative response/methylated-DNA-[protein]-cysteine methyltransferase